MRGPHKNLGSFERSLRIFPYYIPMKYETTQLSQTISVGGCGTVKERSRAVVLAQEQAEVVAELERGQL